MDADLTRTCEMFIRNRELLSDTFRWEGSAMHLIGSAVLTSHDMEPDIDILKKQATIIRENAGMLSPLRGFLKIMLICNMLFSEDPEDYYKNVERAYNLIRITRRKRDSQFYLAAMAMCNVIEDKEELLGLVDKSNELFNKLLDVEGFTRDEKGFTLASIIAATGVEDFDSYLTETRRCAELLGDILVTDSHMLELCLILALDRANAEFKCGRLKEIFRLMETEGIRTSTGPELPVLGTLALLDLTNAETVGALCEVDAYLRGCKGFGTFGCGPDKRHMYAALLVMCTYASVVQAEQSAAASIVRESVISQFAAMAASTMMVTSAVYEALDSELRLY